MIHPHTELKFISPEVGHGVVATQRIPAGTVTWVLDKLDREFWPSEFKALDPIYQNILDTYCYRNNLGKLVLCWDHARYVNHSFNANCLSTAYDFEIAIRDIEIGEQLTDDYGYLNIERPFRGVNEGTKRKVVYPDDLLRYHKVWDKKLLNVMPQVADLKQPLGSLMTEDIWAEVRRIVVGKTEMRSILHNYYSENGHNGH